MSAAAAERAVFASDPSTITGHQGLVLLPVIVTAAPLFTCSLAPDGVPVVEETKSFTVLASGTDLPRKRVFVMAESELEGFSLSLKAMARPS